MILGNYAYVTSPSNHRLCIFDISYNSSVKAGSFVFLDDTTISKTDYIDIKAKKHTQNTDIKLDEGGLNEKLVQDLIISREEGVWKKITEMQYNPLSGEYRVFYET